MLLLLLACVGSSDTKDFPPVIWGDPETGLDDTGVATADDTGDDTGAVDDTGDDTGPVTSDEVCYPGPAEDWTACLPVIPWSEGWGDDYAYPEPLNDSPQYARPLYFIDLAEADPDMALAPNFVLDEFMQEWKGRYGLFMPHVVETLQAIRDNIGGPLVINSGYRNVTYNAGVGGATWSRHMYGDAADMASSVASLDELGEICDLMGAGYIGYYEAHIHCDWRDDPLEPAFYGARRSNVLAPRPALGAILRWDGEAWTAPAEGWDEGEPLRVWTAEDARGKAIVHETTRRFVPPPGTAQVRVDVGHAVWLMAHQPD
ncbi:MAG: hypothetical protein H6739_38115 [Alphaproteobacteria bacterium]|nr:hypothetical protein [Alphaproteobacteria bacterium]